VGKEFLVVFVFFCVFENKYVTLPVDIYMIKQGQSMAIHDKKNASRFMIRSRVVLSTLLLLFIGTTCSHEEPIGSEPVGNTSGSSSISFVGSSVTKASISDLSTMTGDASGFKVYAISGSSPTGWYTDVHGSSINGTNNHIFDSGENKWSFNPHIFWPGGSAGYPVTFFAFYPPNPSGLGSVTGTFSPLAVSAPYTVQPVSSQIDLLAAKATANTMPTDGEYPIQFDHILTMLDFAIIAGAGTTPHIQSLQVVNIGDTRTYDFVNATWQSTPATSGNATYTYFSAVGSAIWPAGNPIVANENASNPIYVGLTASDKHLIVMPQTSPAWRPATPTGGHVALLYRMGTGSGVSGVGTPREVGYANATQHPNHATSGAGYTGPLFVKAGFPFSSATPDFTWDKGVAYTYKIGLGTPGSCNGYILDEFYYNDQGIRTNLRLIEILREGKRVHDKLQDGEIHVTLGVTKWENQNQALDPPASIRVVPKHLFLPFMAQMPASQSIEVICRDGYGEPDLTGTWTLSVPSSATWLKLTLDPLGAGASSSVLGTGSQTVYMVTTVNSSSDLRLAELYLNNDPTDITTIVVQDNEEGSPGTPPAGVLTYSGAFWRASEVGERIIRIPVGSNSTTQSGNWGPWSAALMWHDSKWHPVMGDGVLLSTDMLDVLSLSMRGVSFSGPLTPQSAEGSLSRVYGFSSVVNGTADSGDHITFRIGLQQPFTTWHETGNPARYAIVLLFYGTPLKVQKIFLRQGEGPDAIGGAGGSVRWSVYNLTGANGTTPMDNQSAFTDFPSQAGYYKQFSTATTLYAPIGSFTVNTEVLTSMAAICPDGYKIPNSDGSAVYGPANEMGALLETGTRNFWGYYADGFFDRRQVVGSVTGAQLSTVNATTLDIAYVGRLYYNIATNASLFLPGAGSRMIIGNPANAGSASTYWSQTPIGGESGTNSWTINSSASLVGYQMSTNRAAAYAVRCISSPCVGVASVALGSSASSAIAGNTVLLTATPTPAGANDVTYQWQRLTTVGWQVFATTTVNTSLAIISEFGVNQFRVIASNSCGNATSSIVNVTGTVPIAGGSAARITWDEVNERYVITYDPRNAGLYFKFGSVVGLYSDHESIKDLTPPIIPSTDPYHPTDVAWTPAGASVTYATWNAVPVGQAVNITDSYHNATNVKAGLGDPCRLVGLDLAKIQSSVAGALTQADIDNGIWRLPTHQDNIDFSGYPAGNTMTTLHWWIADQSGNISFGVPGSEFPTRNNGGMHKFLPAAGFRAPSDGIANGQGQTGLYWSNENASPTNGHALVITPVALFTNQGNLHHSSQPVRCVPNVCVPVTDVSISPSTGSVPAGNTILLTATATSGASNVLYQWQENTLSGWVNIAGETAPTCMVIASNVGFNQFRVIAINECGNATSSASVITGTLSPMGGSAARITWDKTAHGGTGGYVLTHDPRNGGLYFKYGGVIGTYSDHEDIKDLTPPLSPSTDTFHPTDVAWTPETSATYATWLAIPYLPLSSQQNITLSFHTPANVKAGFGDACRLVGLNLSTIKNTAAGSLTMNDINNYTWRLPTHQENLDFAGFPQGNSPTTVHWWSENQSGSISFGVAGGEFPSRNASGLQRFLPAAGVREQGSGNILNQGIEGSYWAGEFCLSPAGGRFNNFFSTSVLAGNAMGLDWGVSVRCVYDPCYPVQNVNLTGSITSAAVGTSFILTAGLNPSNAKTPITYVWERSVDGINWQSLGTTTTNTLTTYVAVVGASMNRYRVRVSNECAIASVSSGVLSITGTEPAGAGASSTNTNVYVGAYWRATERGERIIRIDAGPSGSNNTGPWVATVMTRDARFSATDIVFAPALTSGELTTRNISWTTPQEPNNSAESYLLTGVTATSIFGTAGPNEFIEFRIGLNTNHTNASYPARYAVVLLSYGAGKWQKIYIRQGHQPDRVSTVGVGASTYWSPYNLGDITNSTLYPDGLTAFPTQTGYFYPWGHSLVDPTPKPVHPIIPTGAIPGWQQVSNAMYALADACPNGFMMPTGGVETTANFGSLNSSTTTAWGYYADGYFDRRAMNATDYGTDGATHSAVSYTTDKVAYRGMLFYSSATHASLFFPASGYRHNDDGKLHRAGTYGYYWADATTITDVDFALRMRVSNGGAQQDNDSRTYGSFVRCIVDPCTGITNINVPLAGSVATGGTVSLTASLVPSGATTPITYQWQRSVDDGATWINVPSATSATHAARAVIAGVTYYRVIATNCKGSRTSPMIPISGTGNEPTHPAPVYVGAFWKNGQLGERLIRIDRSMASAPANVDGAWRARVIVGDSWIRLDDGNSLDHNNLGWVAGTDSGVADMMTDGANVLPPTAGTDISGTANATNGHVFFRIGLTATQGTGAAPRYGVVLLTYNNHERSQRIFIRQGEDADYLMRKSDAINSGGMNQGTRPDAVEYVPYNLTAETLNAAVLTQADAANPSIVGNRSKFTDYPSQAGALFQFAGPGPGSDDRIRFAWDPFTVVMPLTPPMINNMNYSSLWNTLGPNHETCPNGYRRPNDGPTNAFNLTGDVLGSEVRQSLFLNPQSGSSGNSTNSLTGYYADGWFDRRQIVNSENTNASTQANSTVARGGPNIAYMGRLMFNPDSKASLFFPFAGNRFPIDGGLQQAGTSSAAWSSSRSQSSNGTSWYFSASQNTATVAYGGASATSYSIRCVLDV